MAIALGLMSGTSLDGIDLALVETDGERQIRLGPTTSHDYSAEERTLLRRALADAVAVTGRQQRPGVLAEAERHLTAAHAGVVLRFLADNAIEPNAIDVIGFHGQTVLHRPEARLTLQLGNGAALAAETGIDVVHDFRAADVAAGGQGAPFVPVFHRALVEASDLPGPVAVLNLGGVGNVTYVAPGEDPVAFDTGPGNALIDDLMHVRRGLRMDEGGALALAGAVDEASLSILAEHPYFDLPPPKSLDRNAFVAARDIVSHLSLEDAAATLAAFTARTAASARRWIAADPATWVVCGGGARNRAIMEALGRAVPGRVVTADDVDWSAAMMEAQAFAYLAVRSLLGLPLSFPSTTGVPRPMPGGLLARAMPVEAVP
jgi:anhydro-N-acetylmuramic acid kinase